MAATGAIPLPFYRQSRNSRPVRCRNTRSRVVSRGSIAVTVAPIRRRGVITRRQQLRAPSRVVTSNPSLGRGHLLRAGSRREPLLEARRPGRASRKRTRPSSHFSRFGSVSQASSRPWSMIADPRGRAPAPLPCSGWCRRRSCPAALSGRTSSKMWLRDLRVDAGGRLVEQQQLRPVHERDARGSAAASCRRRRCRRGRRPGRRGRPPPAPRRLALGQVVAAEAVQLAEEAQVLAGRQFGVDRQVLRHDADRAGGGRGRRGASAGRRASPRRPSASSRPDRIDMSVVLPAPLGPSRPNSSPASTASETPSRATVCAVPLADVRDFEDPASGMASCCIGERRGSFTIRCRRPVCPCR